MKKAAWPIVAVFLVSLLACTPKTPVAGLQPVTLQLQWVTQAQFAGYYVARDKGWYEEEGLDVTIKAGGPTVVTFDEVASGTAEFGTALLSEVAAAVDRGQPVISIAQIQQMNGLLLIAKKSSGIKRPADLIGKRIGLWGSSWQAQ